jgi:hypothetical protein
MGPGAGACPSAAKGKRQPKRKGSKKLSGSGSPTYGGSGY